MDLTLTPELAAFRDEVRAFLAAHAGEHEAGAPKDPKGWQKLLIDNGYAARTIPQAYGGYGAEPDILKSRIIAEEFIAAGAPRGMSGQGIAMLVPTLLEVGSEEQKTRWIGPTLRGEIIWCQGYSEPGAGSDLANLQTKAVEDGDDFLISGSKIWTSTAMQAQMMFCLVRTEPKAAKHEGISYILFPMSTPGIEVRPLKTMTGQAEFNEVFFTDVRVPKANVVGGRGRGWFVANTTLKHERGMLGDPNATEARLKALIEVMKTETLDGQRIIDNPIFRDRLMQLQARVFSMKFNGLRTMTDDTAGLARMVVKLQGCELNHQVAALAIDALGELGILYHDGPHLRARGNWQRNYMFDLGLIIGGGTAQIQKNIISERGLGMPREPKVVEAYTAMRFALSEDQTLLQDSIAKALADLSPLDRVRCFADGGETTAPDIWAGLAELGLPGLIVPEEHGGLGLGMVEAALAAEALGRVVAPTPFLGTAVLAPLALTLAGSAEQKIRWLPKLASGEAVAGVAISEPIAGARDGAGVASTAGRLEGRALFALDAPGADLLIVADRTGGLHLAATCETAEPMPGIDATRRLTELTFKATPAEALASNQALDRLRDAAWILLAADTLGAAQAMLDKAVAYAKERKQFGRTIGSFQAVKHLCAEMAAELEPARALVWYAAYAFDHAPDEAPLMAAHAKAHLSEIGRFVARTSTEVHGGIGMTDLLGLHYWFKRIGQNRQLLGGPEKVREWAARLQGLAA